MEGGFLYGYFVSSILSGFGVFMADVAWYKKDYKLPKFGSYFDGSLLTKAMIFVLLPNVFFLVGAYFVGVARPLINIDYLWACLLFTLPYRLLRWLGMLVFAMAVLLDSAMMAMQLFPFLDMAAALSLAPFLVNAPIRYMIIAGLIGIYMILMPLMMIIIAKKTFVSVRFGWAYILVCAVILLGAYHLFREVKYIDGGFKERFAQSDYFVIHSQYRRYRWVAGSEFTLHFNKTPQMIAIDIPHISHHFGVQKSGIQPFVSRPLVTADNRQVGDKGIQIEADALRQPSKKMLLIVAESWGVARDSAVQMDILSQIYKHSDQLDFLDNGYFNFAGATVEGELRELCQLDVEGGYAFNRVDRSAFASCLPQRLQPQGYYSIGMHTGFSGIYERNYLYPKMGFEQTIFAEQVNDKKHCQPFNGVCDSEVFDLIANEFAKHDKLFFYWLTLTSHSPFDSKDIVDNTRFDCNKYTIPQGDICNNFKLHAQFFDDLGKLIARPEMQGVEIIVVGDHMPPIISKISIHNYIQWQDVSWLHLKVKSK